jgi:hypothetical protein
VRPDGTHLAWVLGLWLLLLLLVPKIDWRTIVVRLRAAAAGRRRYFGRPPTFQGEVNGSFGRRVLDLAGVEWPRVLELGVPLYLLAIVVEADGSSRRRSEQAQWESSPSGMLLKHLSGELDEAGLNASLKLHGLLPLAARPAVSSPRPLTMPPIAWRREWERDLATDADGAGVDPGPTVMATPASVPTHLDIRTLGGLHLRHGEIDLAGALLEHPVLSFIWLYLLVRAARSPGDRITRSALADEVSPGLDAERQRERLRGRLRDLQRLPGPLSERLQVDDQFVSMELSGCRFDAAHVVALATECRDKPGLLSSELVEEAHVALAESSGEFLPAWDELEQRITGQRGAASEIVAEVRQQVAAAGVDLLAALGAHYLARREPERAVTQLEEALRRRPDREDLAMKLAAAYQESGQPRRTEQLSREYGLSSGHQAL